MAKKKQSNPDSLLSEVRQHYDLSYAELQMRAGHKTQGFDEYDNLFRSVIDSSKWPYNAKIFIPLTFKSIFSKDTRLITGKVKGKLVAGEYGNELGARIGSELLSSQYDDHDMFFEEQVMNKYFRWSQNTRRYGAGFMFVGWRKEKDGKGKTIFDGPTVEVLDNRKVYLQPGAMSIDTSDYVIVERDMTLDELKRIQDTSMARDKDKPTFQNLDKLEALHETTITREIQSRNSAIRGLDDKRTGQGKHKPFRVLTEYRRDKVVWWLPDYGGDNNKEEVPGLIIRIGKNPYDHGKIPIVRLVYMPIDDDIYGISEIEPARSEQKAVNALVSGFIEAVSNELYPIIKGHPTNVDWNTIEFKPKAAWIMQNPQTDIAMQEGRVTFTRNFVEAYRLLISTHAESMGDSAADASNLAALSADKTATEVRDLALQRGSRDNFNKLFLSAAITKIYMLWWQMNQQFLTDTKVIRVAGKDAIEYFTEEGLDGWTLSDDGYELIAYTMGELAEQGEMTTFEETYEVLRVEGILDDFSEPMMPVQIAGDQVPKLRMNSDDKSGFLAVDGKDLTGEYRFSVDLNTLGIQSDAEKVQAISAWYTMSKEMEQGLAQSGHRIKHKELLEMAGERLNIKNVDQLIETIDQNEMMQQGQMPPGMPGQEQMMDPAMGGAVSPEQLLAQGGVPNGQPV
jgi:hypothetical protein